MYIGSVNGVGVCFEDEREAIDLFSKNPSKNDDGNGVALKCVLYQCVESAKFYGSYLSVNVTDKIIVIFVIARLFYC
jgi:hypothetical protein